MKSNHLIITSIVIFFTFFTACKKNSDSDVEGSQSTMGEVGNKFSLSQIQGIDDATASVKSLNKGISTISISGTLADEGLKELAASIPNIDKFGSYNASTGEFTADIKLKFTTDGIVDYLNVAGRPFVLVKFDAKVGDTYTCERANGGTFTRTVTMVSTENDFPYEGMWIKTITVEEPGRNRAVEKIVYELNHKYGLVHANVFLQDGTVIPAYLHSDNIN